MTFTFIQAEKAEFPVGMLCDLCRRIPHRGETIAVVVDHHAAVVHNLIRQPIENVGQ